MNKFFKLFLITFLTTSISSCSLQSSKSSSENENNSNSENSTKKTTTINNISFSQLEELNIKTSDEPTLVEFSYEPDTTSVSYISVKSSNENVAKASIVSQNNKYYCKITGLKDGQSTITLYSKIQPSVKATLNVYVSTDVTSLSFSSETYSIYVGQSRNITPTYLPTSASEPTITYFSNDTSIVTINNGVITGVSIGQTNVSAYIDKNKNSILDEGEINCLANINVHDSSDILLDGKDINFYYDGTPDKYISSTIYTISNFGDIPYININELAKFYKYVNNWQDFNSLSTVTKEDNLYIYSKFTSDYPSYYAPVYFDIENNKIYSYKWAMHRSINSFQTNNSIPGDMTSYYGIFTESDKTKYISQPKTIVEFNLDKYNLQLIENSNISNTNELYLPLHLGLAIIFDDFNSFYYDGNKSLVYDLDTDYYSYFLSSSTSFCFDDPVVGYLNLTKESENSTQSVYSSSTRISNNLLYPYINTKMTFNYSNNTGSYSCTQAKSSSNTEVAQTLNSFSFDITKIENTDNNEKLVTISYKIQGITFKTIIKLNGNSDYNLDTFKSGLKEYNYNLLCFKLDNFYGLKNDLIGTNTFDNCFKNNTVTVKRYNEGAVYKTNTIYNLLSNSQTISEYNHYLIYIVSNVIGDGHSSLINGAFQGLNANYFYDIFCYQNNYSTRLINLSSKYSQYEALRKTTNSNSTNPGLYFSGNTAIIQFDSFSLDNFFTTSRYDGLNTQYYSKISTMTSSQILSTYQKLLSEQSLIPAVFFAMKVVKSMSNITNVIFDVSLNGGGSVYTIPILLGFMTSDPQIVIKNVLDESIIEYHYKVDMNCDNNYDSNDSLYNDYNYYILVSDYSFSCGTALPTMAKNIGCAKIIGSANSGGGTCPVGTGGFDIFGSNFRYSAPYNLMLKSGNTYINNDGGVPSDNVLSSSYWYNYSYLNTFVNNLN